MLLQHRNPKLRRHDVQKTKCTKLSLPALYCSSSAQYSDITGPDLPPPAGSHYWPNSSNIKNSTCSLSLFLCLAFWAMDYNTWKGKVFPLYLLTFSNDQATVYWHLLFKVVIYWQTPFLVAKNSAYRRSNNLSMCLEKSGYTLLKNGLEIKHEKPNIS